MSLFTIGQISAPITADDSGFNTTINRVEKRGDQVGRNVSASFDRVGRTFQRTGAILTASVTTPLILGARQAVREFALLEGAMMKFNVVFGDQADEVEAWVNEFREGVPLARREIIQAAAAMQDLLVPMGVARQDASEMTREWLELAAALAAFNDVPVDQALDAIRSGIAGQSRPLREFGIDARETALQQTALAEGLMSAGDEMTDQVRQQALLIRAYDQSSDAVDGYEDQLGSTLMQEQELQASFKDTLAVFGQDLQPAYNDLISTLTGVVNWIGNLDQEQRAMIITAGKWAIALGPGLTALGTMVRLLPVATKGIKGLTAAMIANPYLAVGAAILGIATHIALVNTRAKELKDTIDQVLGGDIDTQTIDQLNEVIASMEERIDKFRSQALSMGIDPDEYPALVDMREELDKIIDRRDAIAAGEIDEIINQRGADTTEDAADNVDRLNTAINHLKPTLEATPPIDQILGFDEDPLPTFQNMQQALEDFVAMGEGFDFTDKMFPPESLGALQERLAELREEMRYAFDPEVQERIREEMELTQEQIDQILGRTREVAEESRVWGEGLTSTLSQALLHGRDFEDVLKNIGKQLASRAFVQGVSMLAGGGLSGGTSFAGAVFGGLFHSGGIVPGSGERTIQVRGGEGVFTAGQMKAMGMVGSSGGGSKGKGMVRVVNEVNLDGRRVFDNQRDIEYDLNR